MDEKPIKNTKEIKKCWGASEQQTLLPSMLFMTVALGHANLQDHVKMAAFCGPVPSYSTSIQSLWSK